MDVSKVRSVLACKLKQPKKNCLTPALKAPLSFETSVMAPLAMQRHLLENVLAQQHNGESIISLAVLLPLAHLYQ